MNELFIENRRTHKSQPHTVRSADCEIRHYPKGAGSATPMNAFTIEVVMRNGERREKELINITFTNGKIWSGNFERLQAVIVKNAKVIEALDNLIHAVEHEGEIHGRIVDALKNAKEVQG